MAHIDNMLIIIGYTGFALFLYIIIAFVVGTVKKNNGIMDIFYGPAFIVVGGMSLLMSMLLNGSISYRQIVILTLIIIWAVRLASYLYVRNQGKPEDYRYQALRKRWKTNIPLKSFLKIYLFQGILIFLISIPVWFVNISYNPPITSPFDINSITMWLGTIFWVIGFLFETIGDFSLYAFKKNPENKGKIMDKSVWRYTQHPNYFGETLMWWSIFIIALAVPFGFITFIGPAYLTFQIIKVSGVVLLNKRFRGNDEYADFKKRTSSFIPWFPKKLE